jgi:hypothetical protein
LVLLITFTTSPTYDPGSCSSCSSSRSIRTVASKSRAAPVRQTAKRPEGCQQLSRSPAGRRRGAPHRDAQRRRVGAAGPLHTAQQQAEHARRCRTFRVQLVALRLQSPQVLRLVAHGNLILFYLRLVVRLQPLLRGGAAAAAGGSAARRRRRQRRGGTLGLSQRRKTDAPCRTRAPRAAPWRRPRRAARRAAHGTRDAPARAARHAAHGEF